MRFISGILRYDTRTVAQQKSYRSETDFLPDGDHSGQGEGIAQPGMRGSSSHQQREIPLRKDFHWVSWIDNIVRINIKFWVKNQNAKIKQKTQDSSYHARLQMPMVIADTGSAESGNATQNTTIPGI